jgi:hypothetical protein
MRAPAGASLVAKAGCEMGVGVLALVVVVGLQVVV